MNSQVVLSSAAERETILETLVIQAELGQDELVRAGVATLHPADVAELLNVVEEPEIKQKIFGFLTADLASEVLSLVSPLTREVLTQELSNAALGELVERLAISVFLGMVSALTAAATIGTVEPLVLYKLNQDPAVSSGPLITAVNDLMGTTMYLLVATFLHR